MAETRDDICVIFEGEDWDGNPAMRVGLPGRSLCIRGEYGKRFDIKGPHVWCCSECLEPVPCPTGGHVIITAQRHLAGEHGVSAPLMRR